MAANQPDLLQVLNLCCSSLYALDVYIRHHGIDINHPAVVTRRNELLNSQLITDSDTFQLLKICCNTLDDLQKIVLEHDLDRNDAAVRARERNLQVIFIN